MARRFALLSGEQEPSVTSEQAQNISDPAASSSTPLEVASNAEIATPSQPSEEKSSLDMRESFSDLQETSDAMHSAVPASRHASEASAAEDTQTIEAIKEPVADQKSTILPTSLEESALRADAIEPADKNAGTSVSAVDSPAKAKQSLSNAKATSLSSSRPSLLHRLPIIIRWALLFR